MGNRDCKRRSPEYEYREQHPAPLPEQLPVPLVVEVSEPLSHTSWPGNASLLALCPPPQDVGPVYRPDHPEPNPAGGRPPPAEDGHGEKRAEPGTGPQLERTLYNENAVRLNPEMRAVGAYVTAEGREVIYGVDATGVCQWDAATGELLDDEPPQVLQGRVIV
jgi:hypothetical protein